VTLPQGKARKKKLDEVSKEIVEAQTLRPPPRIGNGGASAMSTRFTGKRQVRILKMTIDRGAYEVMAGGVGDLPEKREEYRELKGYWDGRLCQNGDRDDTKSYDLVRYYGGTHVFDDSSDWVDVEWISSEVRAVNSPFQAGPYSNGYTKTFAGCEEGIWVVTTGRVVATHHKRDSTIPNNPNPPQNPPVIDLAGDEPGNKSMGATVDVKALTANILKAVNDKIKVEPGISAETQQVIKTEIQQEIAPILTQLTAIADHIHQHQPPQSPTSSSSSTRDSGKEAAAGRFGRQLRKPSTKPKKRKKGRDGRLKRKAESNEQYEPEREGRMAMPAKLIRMQRQHERFMYENELARQIRERKKAEREYEDELFQQQKRSYSNHMW
jgi:hypothetical protein